MLAPRTRTVLRWIARIAGTLLLLVALTVLIWLRGALYNHYVRFPRHGPAPTGCKS